MAKSKAHGDSEEYSVRRASIEDISEIVEQRRGMLQEIRTGDMTMLDDALFGFEQWLIPKINSGKYLGWFAVSPDKSVAAGIGLWLLDWPPNLLSTSAFRGYIMNVYTHPAHRKLGLARRLTQTALDWCRANSINVIVLHASIYGRPLYESLGFEANNEMRLILKK